MTLRDRLRHSTEFQPRTPEVEEDPSDPREELTAPRAFLINPLDQSVTPLEYTDTLVADTLGPLAEGYKLDNENNILWALDAPTNKRWSYHFEYMCDPFSIRRYNLGLIIALGPEGQWDEGTIAEYLRFVDKEKR